jgi:excisionase family DNA binding protein
MELLNTQEVAARLGVQPRTLDQWSHRGEGPPFRKVGRFRRYDADELAAWVRSQSHGGAAA